jgi:hypothetical protein
MTSSCPTESAAALGAGWASSNFAGGACTDLIACYCDCGEDRGCVDQCDVHRISAACRDALTALDACTAASCATTCKPGTLPDAGAG